MITTEQIKELREKTSISIAQCKKALEESGGDMEKAMAVLKAQGASIAEKKANRELKAGTVSAYIHMNGAMGAMVVLRSESDFVAKNPEFKTLADDIAMHIAASDPENNDELLAQPFVKDPALTVNDLIKGFVQKFGERIEVVRFVRLDTSVN